MKVKLHITSYFHKEVIIRITVTYGTHQLQLKHYTGGTHAYVYHTCRHHKIHMRFSYMSVT